MEGALADLQLLIELSQLAAETLGLLLLVPLGGRQLQDPGADLHQLLLVRFKGRLLGLFVRLRLQKLLGQGAFTKLRLLLHGIVALQAALRGGPLIQKADDRVLALLRLLVQAVDLRADPP